MPKLVFATVKEEDLLQMKKENKVKVLVFAGALIAMNIVLSRLLVLNIGPTLRITVSQTPVYLAGFWFGPIVGGVCGFLGDLIGSLLQGYAPNPFISLSAILTGVLPGIASYLIKKRMEIWHVLGVLVLNGLIGSLGFTCIGLHLYYGTPWAVLYAGRIVQTILLTAVNTVLVFFLYRSPLTGLVKKSVASSMRRGNRHVADKG